MLSSVQERALRVVAEFGDNGEGWAEVELQFECSTPARETFPSQFWSSMCMRVFGALERNGYIVRSPDGPRLTEQGRRYLAPARKDTP